MKIHFRPVLFFLCIALAAAAGLGGVFVFNQRFQKFLLNQTLKRVQPAATVTVFQYQKKTIHFPTALDLDNVHVSIQKDRELWDLQCSSIRMALKQPFWKRDLDADIDMDGCDAQSSGIALERGNLRAIAQLSSRHFTSLKGDLHLARVGLGQVSMTDVHSPLEVDAREIRLEGWTANAYGGTVTGKIFVDYTPPVNYSIELNLTRIDLDSLQPADTSIYSKMSGQVSGTAKIEGGLKKIATLESDLDIPEGGKIKAAWLKPIMEYVPFDLQKKKLEALIRTDGVIPVEKARLTFQSIVPEKVAGVWNIKSANLDLDLNMDFTINFEPGTGIKDFYDQVLMRMLPLKGGTHE